MIKVLRFYLFSTPKESLQIVKRYKQLPYIILNNKYLVPHPPSKPISRYQLLKKKLPVSETQPKKLHLQKQLKAQYSGLSETQKKNLLKENATIMENFKKQMINHMQKYISPLLIKNLNGFIVFQRIEEIKNKNTPSNMSQINKKWKNLTQQQKNIFQEKAKMIQAKKAQQYQQYVSKYSIPFLNIQKLQIKNIKQSQYIPLPKTEQEKTVYAKFLKTWNLTQSQMNNIILTCIQYKQYKKTLALKKKELEKEAQNKVEQGKEKLDNSLSDLTKP